MRLFITIVLMVLLYACTGNTATTSSTEAASPTTSKPSAATSPAFEAKAPELNIVTTEEQPNVTPPVVVTPENVDGESSPKTIVPEKEVQK